jgi:DNA-directed RNA polymerase subunit K/omega
MSDVEMQAVEPPAEQAPVEQPKGEPIDSRFLFVDVAALRAKQLRRGARPRLDQTDGHHGRPVKPERVAMEEVRRNLVLWSLPDFKAVVDLK